MANPRAMKLFAVALLAGASTAHADTPAYAARRSTQAASDGGGYIDISLKPVAEPTIKPRLLGNARPACGNTGGKVDRPSNCTAAETRTALAQDREDVKAAQLRAARMQADHRKLMAVAEAVVRADPSIKARLLINGRPACGNTMTKASPPPLCRIGEDGTK